jgi:coenzyme F420-0:L-glutamate ligase/coenzyme F420-1:gamma-L-glutamate ligase
VLTAFALANLPDIQTGDDLAALIIAAARAQTHSGLEPGDVLVVAHKVVSKAEGRTRKLDTIDPSQEAIALATTLDKDPRHVQAVLDESRAVIRAERGVLICETHHGFICANAGVDASNATEPDTLTLLPEDPDASARRLRARIETHPAVLITDSFGRAWRHGQVDVAIGCAGLKPLDDWRGRTDATGRPLTATWIAVADELAAAADLARAKDARQPVVLVRGAAKHVTADDGLGAKAILRPQQEDLFR